MTKFTTTDTYAEVQFVSGGRIYAFQGGELEVEDESDARRVRTFAADRPDLEISEVREELEPEPAPAPPDPSATAGAEPEGDVPEDAPVDPSADAGTPASEEPVPTEPEPESAKPLERMNRGELVAVAEAKGVDTVGLSKAQIREALEAK